MFKVLAHKCKFWCFRLHWLTNVFGFTFSNCSS